MRVTVACTLLLCAAGTTAFRLRTGSQLALLEDPEGGEEEERKCEHDCFGHGHCDAKNRKCTCQAEWHGQLCDSTFLHATSNKQDYSAEATAVPEGPTYTIDLDGFTTADAYAKFGQLYAVLLHNKAKDGDGTTAAPGSSSSSSSSFSSSPSSPSSYRHKAGYRVGADFAVPHYTHVKLDTSAAGDGSAAALPALVVSSSYSLSSPSVGGAPVPVVQPPAVSGAPIGQPNVRVATHIVPPPPQQQPQLVGVLTDTNGLGVAALESATNSELIDLGR